MAIERATDNKERDKAAGNTPGQQQLRDYHAGDYQTTDPVTGEARDTPLPEVKDDALRGEDDAADASAANASDTDYDSWTVEDLRAEAGDLTVKRGDGSDGAPLKADYVKALRKRDRK